MNWPEALIATVGTAAVFAFAIVAIWQAFKTWQVKVRARVELMREEEYRALAAEATAAQQAIAAEQQRIASELAEIRARLAAIEKLLHEVG